MVLVLLIVAGAFAIAAVMVGAELLDQAGDSAPPIGRRFALAVVGLVAWVASLIIGERRLNRDGITPRTVLTGYVGAGAFAVGLLLLWLTHFRATWGWWL